MKKAAALFLVLLSVSAEAQPQKGPQPLGFERALDVMLEKSTVIGTQEAKVRATEDTLTGRKLVFLPSIAVSASQGTTSINPDVNQGFSATASVNLFKGGADVAAVSAAKSDVHAQTETLGDVKLRQETDAVTALAAVVEKQLEVLILEKQTRLFGSFLEIARQRYNKGLLPMQEVDKLTVDMQNVEARLNDARSELALAQGQLDRFAGPIAITPEWPWKDRVTSPKVSKLLEKHLELMERPDYQAAASNLEAEDRRTRQAWGTILPSLDLGFTSGYSQLLGQNGVNTTYVSLTMPLFGAFKDWTAYRVQAETKYQAELRLRQTERDAAADWDSAKQAFQVALTTALAREKTLAISRKLYDASLARLKVGHASANDLQIDQTRLSDSEILAVQGWQSAHNAFTRLCHALGRSVKNCE